MLRVKAQSEPLQTIDFERADLVRAAHLVPELEQKRGDPAHPAAGYTDQMNPVPLARQEFWQIDFRGERHDCDCVYLSIVSTTSAAAFFGARRAEFSDMRSSLLGSLDQFPNLSREQITGEIGLLAE